jgi:hypothetical protein
MHTNKARRKLDPAAACLKPKRTEHPSASTYLASIQGKIAAVWILEQNHNAAEGVWIAADDGLIKGECDCLRESLLDLEGAWRAQLHLWRCADRSNTYFDT